MKNEWRKSEKGIYIPKAKAEFIDLPAFKFLTIAGEGNPNSDGFGDYIGVLYALSYAIKMTLKKRSGIDAYMDYTVYPLEGVWDIREEARAGFTGVIDKDDLVFTLMIRQPDFVTPEFVEEMRDFCQKKNPNPLLKQVNFETITEGPCVQMLHIGSYDNEAATFAIMEDYACANGLTRVSKIHREIYLSDFRKVAEEKLKTTLRFRVK